MRVDGANQQRLRRNSQFLGHARMYTRWDGEEFATDQDEGLAAGFLKIEGARVEVGPISAGHLAPDGVAAQWVAGRRSDVDFADAGEELPGRRRRNGGVGGDSDSRAAGQQEEKRQQGGLAGCVHTSAPQGPFQLLQRNCGRKGDRHGARACSAEAPAS